MATGQGKSFWTTRKALGLGGGVLAVAILAGVVWQYFWPRTIKLWVVTDYAFRERRDWQTVLDKRLAALNGLYAGTGVRWQVLSSEHLDPVSGPVGLDARRAELEKRLDSPADVVLSLTSQSEGSRLGSVNAFSHAAIIVDFPQQTEEQNRLILAHELARLFGAPVEAAGSGTLMALPPQKPGFPPKTAALIHRLRRYDFMHGIQGLEGKWSDTALDALAGAYSQPAPKPLAHAHLTLALALANEGRAAEATPHAREAVKLDPRSIDARQALAHVLVEDLQMDAALREIREAVRLFPNDAGLHGSLGAALGRQLETDEALRELRKAEELDPKNPNYPVVMGTLMVQQAGKMDEGVAEFEKAVQLDPKLESARVWLARMRDLRAQATSDLEADRRKAHETPNDAEALYRVGVDEARLGEHPEARAAFQKAVELNPRHARALSDLAAMDYYASDYAAAWKHVKEARAAGFEPPLALINALQRKMKSEAESTPDAFAPGSTIAPTAK